MWKSMALGMVVAICLLATLSCNHNRVYEVYQTLETEGWHKDTIPTFHFEIADTLSIYNVFVNIRNKNNYPYSNLWLFIDIEAPDQSVLRDTFEISLARPDGKWLGKGIGNLFDLQALYKRNVYFPVSGTYTIHLQQGMRNELLPGVNDIGIRIEKSN